VPAGHQSFESALLFKKSKKPTIRYTQNSDSDVKKDSWDLCVAISRVATRDWD